jgi:Helix-turn-helix domain
MLLMHKMLTRVWFGLQAELSPSLFLTLYHLARICDKYNQACCYPSVATIAARVHLSVRQTQRVLHMLAALGYIRITYQASPYGTNVYTLIRIPPLATLRGARPGKYVTLPEDPTEKKQECPRPVGKPEKKMTSSWTAEDHREYARLYQERYLSHTVP